MRSQIKLLREQLASQITQRGANHPQIEHLRWQIASLERQLRQREAAAGMFGIGHRADVQEPGSRPAMRRSARGGA